MATCHLREQSGCGTRVGHDPTACKDVGPVDPSPSLCMFCPMHGHQEASSWAEATGHPGCIAVKKPRLGATTVTSAYVPSLAPCHVHGALRTLLGDRSH